MLSILTTIKNNKYLISTWVRFNIQSNYIDSKLGLLWIILQPILQTLIYTFAFGTLIGRQPRGGVPFILFFLAGTTVWQFISSNWMQAGNLIVKNNNLMSQVKTSAEALVIIQLLERFVDFLISFVILMVVSALFGYYPTYTYLYLPLVLFFIILTAIGGSFFLSSLGVFIRDIPTVTSLILRFLFFLSGVIITPDMLPESVGGFLSLNPLMLMIEAVRDLVIYSEIPSIQSFLYMGSFSLLLYIMGYAHFKKRQGVFVDYR
jgi:ABC-type polysaccharide/polyol phosphate export permease